VVGLVVLLLAAAGAGLFFLLHAGGPKALLGSASVASEGRHPAEQNTALPVNTVRPAKKTLVRTYEQPGSVKPWAQTELYAKTSGYLRLIQRDLPPEFVAELVVRQLAAFAAACSGPPGAGAVRVAAAAEVGYWRAPEKDIGSRVTTGELLLALDAPELLQDIAQKDSLWQQRVAELESARTALATFQAAIQAVEAQKKTAEADIKRAAADLTYYSKQLERHREMVRRQTFVPELAEETLHRVEAAQAALDSAHAKALAVQAELGVVTSKLSAARADLRVKEAQVHVALEELHRAEILAEYANIHAPFNGMITYRGVDEGDFVQNSSSGQTRLLMTVASIDKVKVVLQVPEREAIWVEPGAEAMIQVDARERWQVKGRVARVAHSLDSQALTMRVEVDLPNADHKLLPGMYGHMTLTLQTIPDARAIPATAVYSRGGENYIIQVENGRARRQRVRIRYDDGHEVEVVKLVNGRETPLDGSEELVVSNKGELRDGQRVRPTPVNGR
jgi:RND family efflux transporter MFP subunit